MFTTDVFSSFFLFTRHGVSELSRPTVAKFCTMVCSKASFVTHVQKFGKAFPETFYGPKYP